MGFFAPWFFGGLAAISLPVYFHLLRQHKSEPRPFSSLMFFERSTQSSIKHRRLRYLSLLALRVILLLLLALAFTGPYLMRTSGLFGQGNRRVVLVIDNSFSMRAAGRLATAKQEAVSTAGTLAPGDRTQVAALGARLDFLTLPTGDRREVISAIQSIEAGDSRSSYGEFARAIRATAETAREPVEVHLFTDLQQSSMPSGFSDLALPTDVRLVIHPVAGDLSPNFAVENVIAPASLFDPKKTTVQATIAGYGAEAATQKVTLVAAGRVLASKELAVPHGGRATVEFQSLEVPYGFTRCEVRIQPADQLPDDDHFLFAVERADRREILFVRRRASSDDLLYFRTAVDSTANTAFRVQSVTLDAVSGLDLSRYAVVVLSDPARLPEAFENELRQFVRAGGGLLVAAGTATARAPRIPVLDLPVVDSVYAGRRGDLFRTAGANDSSHPAVGVPELWSGVKFYQAVRVDAAGARVLSRLDDGTPLVAEREIGEGRALLFTSTFDNVSNDLPLYPAFVAFIEHATHYLSRIEDRTSARVVDSFLDLRADKGGNRGVELIDPNGERALSLEQATQTSSLPLRQEGFYELRRAGDQNEMIAVNADRRESNLAVLPAEAVSLWQGSPGAETSQAVVAEQETRRPVKLWWYIMLLVLLAAVSESFFAARYLKIDRGAA